MPCYIDHACFRDVTQLASMCKLKVGRLVREVSDSCLQFWGGMGFTNDVPISRMYRLVKLGTNAAMPYHGFFQSLNH